MPRLKARGEVFEILYEFKQGDLDIGEAYDLIYDEIRRGSSKTFASDKRFKPFVRTDKRKPKRKLSAWNKYVKANSKKPRFRYRNGKLNLKKMAVAFRKTPAGKKKRR